MKYKVKIGDELHCKNGQWLVHGDYYIINHIYYDVFGRIEGYIIGGGFHFSDQNISKTYIWDNFEYPINILRKLKLERLNEI